MLPFAHFLVGGFIGYLFARFKKTPTFLYFIIGGFIGIFADFDIFFSKVINLPFIAHRGVTHTLVFVVLISFAFYFLFKLFRLRYSYWMVFVSYMSHIFLDLIDKGSVCLLFFEFSCVNLYLGLDQLLFSSFVGVLMIVLILLIELLENNNERYK